MSTPIYTCPARRGFVKRLAAAAGLGGLAARLWAEQAVSSADAPFFLTRGVVLVPDDLTLHDWPARAKEAGLTTIALHPFPGRVRTFVESAGGQEFLAQCRQLGLQVEYELHAMAELLPRDLFKKAPDLFRMNEKGDRSSDANLCVHSDRALSIAAENAVGFARTLRPDTGRYFFWGDDGKPWCRCPRCASLSDCDQATVLENHLLAALRRDNPKAQLAHLAYHSTLWPPKQVKPTPGVFLEYAPIRRNFAVPLAAAGDDTNRRHLDALDANLEVFGRDGAQALEYWLDVSMFSKWKKPAVKLPFNPAAFASDVNTYGSRGVRHVTTFAVYIDADYVARFGPPPLQEYGTTLRHWHPPH
jgi:hypothetical protein